MKLVCNVLYAQVGGGLTYATNQVAALARRDDVTLEVLVAPWNVDAFLAIPELPPSAAQVIKVPNVSARFAWEQFVLPLRLRRRGADVLLSSGNFAPLRCSIPSVMVLQNLNFVGDGRIRSASRGAGYRAKVRMSIASMRRADAVVSVSETLTSAMREEPALARANIVTVRSAAPAVIAAADRTRVVELVGDEPYLLSVANDYPHKRLEDLAALVRQLGPDGAAPNAPTRVVVAGNVSEQRREMIRGLAGPSADRLRFLGSVAEPALLAGLFRDAFALVITSEMESWGLTLAEAGAQGCPAIATDLPAHREVAGDHARYFPPGSVVALMERLHELGASPERVPWDLGRGWDEHGAELMAVLRSAVDGSGR